MEVKQVIVVRSDLNMPKGKLASQVAHASLAAILKDSKESKGKLEIKMTNELKYWLDNSFAKIVLKVDSKVKLIELFLKAKIKGLPCAEITDAGDTFFKEPTYTCIAIGPAKATDIDNITGNLKLM